METWAFPNACKFWSLQKQESSQQQQPSHHGTSAWLQSCTFPSSISKHCFWPTKKATKPKKNPKKVSKTPIWTFAQHCCARSTLAVIFVHFPRSTWSTAGNHNWALLICRSWFLQRSLRLPKTVSRIDQTRLLLRGLEEGLRPLAQHGVLRINPPCSPQLFVRLQKDLFLENF